MRKTKKFIAALLSMSVIATTFPACANKQEKNNDKYTYNAVIESSQVHTVSPHEWEYAAEDKIMYLTQRGLYDVIHSETKEYEFVYEMAQSAPIDVTKDYAGDKKYGIPSDAKDGYAFKIELRQDAKWEDGTPINADTYIYSMKQVIDPKMQNYRAANYYAGKYALANAYEYYNDGGDYESVGLIKNDEYSITIIYDLPMESEYDLYYNLSRNWIVKEDLYEDNKHPSGDLTKTTYGTDVETYSSYGPYKLVEWQSDKIIKLTRNDQWYGWKLDEFKNQYQTTDVIYNVLDEHATQLQLFEQGKLDKVNLITTDLEKYGTSDYVIYTPGSRTVKISFNTDREALEARTNNGVNKLLMLYKDFRKAISLSINRTEFCQQAYPSDSPAYGLMNDRYIYDVNSFAVYRENKFAKEALCNVYDTKNYEELNGYNVASASVYMEKAYQDALKAGDITEEERVVLKLNVNVINDETIKAHNFLNDSVKEAAKGTSLEGRISIELVEVEDEYAQMLDGLADIIFTAWSGAEVNPSEIIQCYCNENYYADSEHGFDNKQLVTLTIAGEEYTMSFFDWYDELYSGKWASADKELKVEVIAAIEGAILNEFNCIPLRSVRQASLLSQKVEYVTYDYNGATIEEYGGFRFMTYNFTDAEWEKYCENQNNKLTY